MRTPPGTPSVSAAPLSPLPPFAWWYPAPTASTARVPAAAGRGLARRWAALVLGVWTLVALVTTEQSYYTLTRMGRDVQWERLLVANMSSCWLWALLTAPMVWLARRYRIDRTAWPRLVPLHVAFALVFHLTDALVQRALPVLFAPRAGPRPPFDVALVQGLFINLTSYAVVVALTYAVDYARLYREREVAAAQLTAQLTAARLHALQSQLRPHFLFNTLNTIAEQVHTDAAGADRMITRLAGLLRASFAEGNEVPLRDELDVLRGYVDIMAVRFRGRVEVAFDVDPEALDAAVPRFLLQPLVENALRHGIEPLGRGGRVDVVARRRLDVLELEVRDTGRGFAAPSARRANGAGRADGHGSSEGAFDLPREGVGLRNTRDRLHQLYGAAHRFALRPRAGGGVIAAVTIPYRPADGVSS